MLLDELRERVRKECHKDTNPFSPTAFIHIKAVVKHAKYLAENLNADKEICEIASWLHDWGSIIGRYENHHLESVSEADRFLRIYNYPEDKIESVKYCILTHRGSRDLKRETLEAEILASADAMSHFTTLDTLFHMVYVTHNLSYEVGKAFVRKKLQIDWNKLMPEAKELVKTHYEILMGALNDP